VEDWAGKALLAVLAGILAVDRIAFFQSMLSRPLPAAALAGLLVGQPQTGLFCGIFLEAVWLTRHPVGGAIPPDETLTALAAVAAACAAPQGWKPEAAAALGVIVGLPYGYLGRALDLRVRKANGVLLLRVRAEVAVGNRGAVGRAQRLGALRFFGMGILGGAAAVLVAPPVAGLLVSAAPMPMQAGMEIFAVILPVIGAGALLSGIAGWGPRAALGLGALGGWLSGSAFLPLKGRR
jgi:PTS system mannose-specific IIC component